MHALTFTNMKYMNTHTEENRAIKHTELHSEIESYTKPDSINNYHTNKYTY